MPRFLIKIAPVPSNFVAFENIKVDNTGYIFKVEIFQKTKSDRHIFKYRSFTDIEKFHSNIENIGQTYLYLEKCWSDIFSIETCGSDSHIFTIKWQRSGLTAEFFTKKFR